MQIRPRAEQESGPERVWLDDLELGHESGDVFDAMLAENPVDAVHGNECGPHLVGLSSGHHELRGGDNLIESAKAPVSDALTVCGFSVSRMV